MLNKKVCAIILSFCLLLSTGITGLTQKKIPEQKTYFTDNTVVDNYYYNPSNVFTCNTYDSSIERLVNNSINMPIKDYVPFLSFNEKFTSLQSEFLNWSIIYTTPSAEDVEKLAKIYSDMISSISETEARTATLTNSQFPYFITYIIYQISNIQDEKESAISNIAEIIHDSGNTSVSKGFRVGISIAGFYGAIYDKIYPDQKYKYMAEYFIDEDYTDVDGTVFYNMSIEEYKTRKIESDAKSKEQNDKMWENMANAYKAKLELKKQAQAQNETAALPVSSTSKFLNTNGRCYLHKTRYDSQGNILSETDKSVSAFYCGTQNEEVKAGASAVSKPVIKTEKTTESQNITTEAMLEMKKELIKPIIYYQAPDGILCSTNISVPEAEFITVESMALAAIQISIDSNVKIITSKKSMLIIHNGKTTVVNSEDLGYNIAKINESLNGIISFSLRNQLYPSRQLFTPVVSAGPFTKFAVNGIETDLFGAKYSDGSVYMSVEDLSKILNAQVAEDNQYYYFSSAGLPFIWSKEYGIAYFPEDIKIQESPLVIGDISYLPVENIMYYLKYYFVGENEILDLRKR